MPRARHSTSVFFVCLWKIGLTTITCCVIVTIHRNWCSTSITSFLLGVPTLDLTCCLSHCSKLSVHTGCRHIATTDWFVLFNVMRFLATNVQYPKVGTLFEGERAKPTIRSLYSQMSIGFIADPLDNIHWQATAGPTSDPSQPHFPTRELPPV